MKKKIFIAILMVFAGMWCSCEDYETYAEMKEREKAYIDDFIRDQGIKVITKEEFEKDTITNVDDNEYVLFADKGIYMQIVRKGEGASVVEMSKEEPDSTVRMRLLCRFMEYDIDAADTTYTNFFSSAIVDKMQCTYERRGRTYKANFTEGYMRQYHGEVVPTGWLKPLDFIRLSKDDSKIAKVRLIVPHSAGTTNASQYVLPYYYEITFQMGR
jgi:hypothetical protein